MPRSSESALLGSMATTKIAIDARHFCVVPQRHEAEAGARRVLRFMHVTDSHVDLGPDPESGSEQLCEFLHGRYTDGIKATEQRGIKTIAVHSFESHVELAAELGADLVVHTGDLLNFPSPRAASWAAGVMSGGGQRDFFFTSGNHDWQHYPETLEGTGANGGSDRLRADWCAKALAPLFPDGREPLHWAEERGGVRFIAIDNSSGYILPAQLEFFRKNAGSQLRSGDGELMAPTVLMVHIPLFSAALLAEARSDGIAEMSADSLLCGESAPVATETDQQRQRLATTREFLLCVEKEPSLVAVLSGHIHDHNCHPFGKHGAVQITTDSGACESGVSVVSGDIPPCCTCVISLTGRDGCVYTTEPPEQDDGCRLVDIEVVVSERFQLIPLRNCLLTPELQ